MKKLVIALFLLLLIVPAFAKQNVGFGFTISGEGSGIFFMIPSKTKINPEIVTSGYITEYHYDLSLGGRVLYDLGQKGVVSRYTVLPQVSPSLPSTIWTPTPTQQLCRIGDSWF